MSYWRDEWPSHAGVTYDGKGLLQLLQQGRNPFEGQWNPQQLIDEVEKHVGGRVVDIPFIAKGSNNFGIALKMNDGRELVARLARGDVNMPDFDGFPIETQVAEVRFEAAAYDVVRSEAGIRASRLLHHRAPVQHPGPKSDPPKDISGRRLMVFEKEEGSNNVWKELSESQKGTLLDELATVRAALFNFKVPEEFASRFVHDRLFKFKPEAFSVPPAPTRDFWLHVVESKIHATIGNEGDVIGWEDDHETVGPIALAAKQSLLRILPIIMPEETTVPLYRSVLEHGDFGIHNTSIKLGSDGNPKVTSLYDWETGCIAPALLSDPLVAAGPVDLIIDDDGVPSVTRIPKNAMPEDRQIYQGWSQRYFETLFREAPDLKKAIEAGLHLRHLWFALREWRGGDSEKLFGELGTWAEGILSKSSSS